MIILFPLGLPRLIPLKPEFWNDFLRLTKSWLFDLPCVAHWFKIILNFDKEPLATYAISTPLNRTLADQEVAEFERLNSTIIGEEQNNSIVDSFESDFAPAESHQPQTEKASVVTIGDLR